MVLERTSRSQIIRHTLKDEKILLCKVDNLLHCGRLIIRYHTTFSFTKNWFPLFSCNVWYTALLYDIDDQFVFSWSDLFFIRTSLKYFIEVKMRKLWCIHEKGEYLTPAGNKYIKQISRRKVSTFFVYTIHHIYVMFTWYFAAELLFSYNTKLVFYSTITYFEVRSINGKYNHFATETKFY